MRNFTIYLALFLCLFADRITAQTFEDKAKAIGDKIENITKEEKAALKFEVENVNKMLEAGTITSAQADQQKIELAEKRARNIETRTNEANAELSQLVKDKIDGKIRERDSSGRFSIQIDAPIRFRDRVKEETRRDSTRGDSRTTSQFVYSLMLSSLAPNGSVSNSNLHQFLGNDYEWGLSFTTRILGKSNLLQAKYGLSLMYNNNEPTDNRYFVRNGDVTELVESEFDLDHSRLRNVYLMLPLHLEFDFGKSKTPGVLRKQRGWRLGIGGYGGFRLKSKQVLRYEVDGDKVESRRKGDFNVNDFNYGLSTYIGYKTASLYVKYDLQPLFENNPVDHNHLAAGIRWDFN